MRIGERFGLRGPDVDKLNSQALATDAASIVKAALDDLKSMTITVVDGDFPREVLSKQNLTFAEYRMPSRRNRRQVYDANLKGSAGTKEGVLKLGAVESEQEIVDDDGQWSWLGLIGLLFAGLFLTGK